MFHSVCCVTLDKLLHLSETSRRWRHLVPQSGTGTRLGAECSVNKSRWAPASSLGA